MSRDNLFLWHCFGSVSFSLPRLALYFTLLLCLFGIVESKNLFTLPEELLKSAEAQYEVG
jgi:hypothetical protein